jgi:putative acetyltransferase
VVFLFGMNKDYSIEHVTADSQGLDDARQLFTEYVNELNEDLAFQSLGEELKDPLKKYGPPAGSLYLVYDKQTPVACVALQPLQEPGTCEMKRLFVRPAYRKEGLGEKLVALIVKDATDRGYRKMVLDTLDRLRPAIALYEKHGFTRTAPYYENPLPGVVYMQKELK